MPTVTSGISGWPGTLWGPPVLNRRKVRATVDQYAPNLLGYTRATMDGTMGNYTER